MGRPQRKTARRVLQNVEVLPADPSPPRESGDTFSMKKDQFQQTSQRTQRDIKQMTGLGPDSVPAVDQTRDQPRPAAATPASGESEMAQTSQQYRRRRARGIRTSSQGVTGQARVERKTLLGQ